MIYLKKVVSRGHSYYFLIVMGQSAHRDWGGCTYDNLNPLVVSNEKDLEDMERILSISYMGIVKDVKKTEGRKLIKNNRKQILEFLTNLEYIELCGCIN